MSDLSAVQVAKVALVAHQKERPEVRLGALGHRAYTNLDLYLDIKIGLKGASEVATYVFF